MNPLEQLQPLMAPAPIGWWPPAPGWWLLALLLPLGLCLAWRRYRNGSPRRPRPNDGGLEPRRQSALDELARLRRPYDQPAGPWLQQLNALLKRLSLQHYPESACHTLSGRAWLAFLDNRCPAAGLTRWMVLVEGAYRPDCRLDDKAIDDLYQSIATWIRKHV